MGADTIARVAEALAGAFGVAKPIIDDIMAQKYDKQHQERIEEFRKIMAIEDSDLRAVRLSAYVVQLLSKAGIPVVSLDDCIAVPRSVLAALITEVSDGIKTDAMLKALTYK